MKLRPFFLLILLLTATTMITYTTSAKELSSHLYKETLSNKLTVLVKETPGTKVATVQIWVKAGSIYEDKNEAGITHLIEHMIFKGTPTRGLGRVAGDIEEVGGRINAYTSFEYTVYHATLSARFWERGLDVLTDALRHSTFDPDELEREKKVILEEIRMRNDRPETKLFEQLMTTAYTVHPYRLPIIGTAQSVTGFTRDDILKYMQDHYHAENFTVVVVGDVRYADVLSAVKNLMGDIEQGDHVQPPLPQEPDQDAPRFFQQKDDINQTHLALAFPVTPFVHPDTPVLDVIAAILGQGEASRLFNELRNEKRLVYRVSAAAFTPKDKGLMEATATLDAAKLPEAMEAMLEEFFRLKYLRVSEEELNRVKRNLESDFVFNLERAEGQARTLGSFEFLTGDPREDEYLIKVRTVSADDVMRVAQKYFTTRNISVGCLLPLDATMDLNLEMFVQIIAKAEEAAKNSVPPSLIINAYLNDVHRFQLANGITLLVREDHSIPTVSMRAIFPGGLRSETEATNGAFAFISELQPTGTEKLSSRELALAIAEMAGSVSGFNGKNTFGLKADFLARFFDDGLRLFRDIIITPAFDEAEAEKIRPELLAQLKQQDDSLPSLSFREFNRLLFQGHPYALNNSGSEAAIKNFTTGNLKKIYKEHAIPEKMVLAVAGDVKAGDVQELVDKYFGGWANPAENNDMVQENFLPPPPPARPEFFSVERDKEQVHIVIGFLGVPLSSEDRYPLEIIETVLSGQSGRLFNELRDKQSLAYSLSAFSLFGLETGSFGIYIGTSPDKRDEVIKALWKELYQIQEETVSDEELTKAKNLLISQYELGLQTHGAQAMEMGLNETYGLGQDYGNRYIDEIEKIDGPRVLEVARRYIQPDHYVMVTVGAK
ncbi:MAG: insulinase family protein [Proteobacteria bacterium]|nr:insulinase family protein [Pseudomonadota bacterium]MBU4297161.1 insulinase family protein [Pseudomonadota bacterium]MCG2749435.1 insulinase family protein [Desulfobulbaceae bacterium]